MKKEQPPHPIDLQRHAYNMSIEGKTLASNELEECSEAWEAERAIVEALSRSNTIVQSKQLFSRIYTCVLCGSEGKAYEELKHEQYCPWRLSVSWVSSDPNWGL
jgi:hypothetical protein